MTIVHINIGLGGGGAEHVILELAKKGNQDGVKNIVVSISYINQIGYKFTNENIEVYQLHVNSFASFFKGVNKLHTIINSIDNVILHCHMFHGLMMGICYNIKYKKLPIIFTLHSTLVKNVYRRLILFFTKPLRKVDINFSERSNKWYLKTIYVIPNGVDFGKFNSTKNRVYDKDKEKFIFLFLARIEVPKNPLFLITLVSELEKCGKSNFEIRIAGDGAMRKELENLISKNRYEDFIKILGFQDDVDKIMQNSHCLILPSLWEGLPISLIEASASKLPVVTTPVGSIPQYFNKSNSFISELPDFYLAMIEIMDNYDEAKIRAKKLFYDNKNVFDINNVYQKHKVVYKKILNVRE